MKSPLPKRKPASIVMPAARPNLLAAIALGGILLILALRLTMGETLGDTFNQRLSAAMDHAAGKPPEITTIAGPAVTVALACFTFLLAALAAFSARGKLAIPRLGRLALIALILTLAVASAFHAADRFAAIVGACDLAMALLAGWSIGLLCQPAILGNFGRRTVMAALLAILTVTAAKAFNQQFVEFPDLLKYYHDHRTEVLQQQGIDPTDAYRAALYDNRMNAQQVSGFLSLSNVMANAWIGLVAVAAGLITVAFINQKNAPRQARKPGEIPLPSLLLVLASLILLAALIVIPMTKSKGGTPTAYGVTLAVILGMLLHKWVARHRRKIVAVTAILLALGAAGVIAMGIKTDLRASKSLMFRWHYWTASVPMIKDHATLGVGLNNFGTYYTVYKRPSSPEDVADPHSFFIRFAAELGIPATLLIAALVFWTMLAATRKYPEPCEQASHSALPFSVLIIIGGIGAALWWGLHLWLVEPPGEYFLYLTIFAAILAVAAWCIGWILTDVPTPHIGMRSLAFAALIGALGMLLYDQINMALVTGPVAMLFWSLLGLADSYGSPTAKSSTPAAISASILLSAATLATAALILFPLLNGAFAWDPAPYEILAAEKMTAGDPQSALTALDQAISRAPRHIDLLLRRFELKLQLNPYADISSDVHEILSLDKTSAELRKNLALRPTTLPIPERINMLEESLRLDDQLPEDEIKRLPRPERERIQQAITQLKSTPR